jgi:hypothetical protein
VYQLCNLVANLLVGARAREPIFKHVACARRHPSAPSPIRSERDVANEERGGGFSLRFSTASRSASAGDHAVLAQSY